MPYLPRLLSTLIARAGETGQRSFPLHGCVALESDGDRWKELWRLET
jgi:hypothetical protein